MSNPEIPTYSVDLIKKLDKEITYDPPRLNESERSIFYRAGMRALVDKLLADLEETDNYDPEKNIL